jgi:hypothetical protein
VDDGVLEMMLLLGTLGTTAGAPPGRVDFGLVTVSPRPSDTWRRRSSRFTCALLLAGLIGVSPASTSLTQLCAGHNTFFVVTTAVLVN